jgi:hypothetical protein
MGESLQSSPAHTRKKPPAPPHVTQGTQQLGIDHGAFAPSFRGNGLTRSVIERPCSAAQQTQSGHDTSASAVAAVVSFPHGA